MNTQLKIITTFHSFHLHSYHLVSDFIWVLILMNLGASSWRCLYLWDQGCIILSMPIYPEAMGNVVVEKCLIYSLIKNRNQISVMHFRIYSYLSQTWYSIPEPMSCHCLERNVFSMWNDSKDWQARKSSLKLKRRFSPAWTDKVCF